MVLNDIVIQQISDLFELTFPSRAIKGRINVYYGDGFANFPMTYYDISGKIVVPKFEGWDSPEMEAQSKLQGLFSKEILKLRNGVAKENKDYWNHFLFVLDSKKANYYHFSYNPKLDDQNETETRDAIGNELYEILEQKRKNFKLIEE